MSRKNPQPARPKTKTAAKPVGGCALVCDGGGCDLPDAAAGRLQYVGSGVVAQRAQAGRHPQSRRSARRLSGRHFLLFVRLFRMVAAERHGCLALPQHPPLQRPGALSGLGGRFGAGALAVCQPGAGNFKRRQNAGRQPADRCRRAGRLVGGFAMCWG